MNSKFHAFENVYINYNISDYSYCNNINTSLVYKVL